jgi:hypothetical protein
LKDVPAAIRRRSRRGKAYRTISFSAVSRQFRATILFQNDRDDTIAADYRASGNLIGLDPQARQSSEL